MMQFIRDAAVNAIGIMLGLYLFNELLLWL